ncbi:hypothetical protein G6F46_014428 [Rhizopus delemar]|nr:hypothetical protein G6F46_014428 [Rhizopus delemar]
MRRSPQFAGLARLHGGGPGAVAAVRHRAHVERASLAAVVVQLDLHLRVVARHVANLDLGLRAARLHQVAREGAVIAVRPQHPQVVTAVIAGRQPFTFQPLAGFHGVAARAAVQMQPGVDMQYRGGRADVLELQRDAVAV